MYIDFIVSAVTFFVSLFLAIFVYLKNKRSGTNIYFSIIILLGGLYALFNFLSLDASSDQNAFFWAKMILFSSVPVGPLFYFFVKTFPSRAFFFNRKIQIFIIVWAVVNYILIPFNLIFSSVVIVNGSVEITPGKAVASFGLLQSLTVLAASIALIKKYRSSTGLLRQQLLYISVGIIVSFSALLLITVFLPLAIGETGLISISPLFILILGISIAYSIVRYRFMDIRVLFSRSIIYAALVTFVTLAFVLTTYLGSRYISTGSSLSNIGVLAISALLIVLLLNPIKLFLARITNKVFFSAQIDYPVVTKTLTNIINEEIELDHLAKRFSIALEDNLRLQHATILLPMGTNVFKEPDELIHVSKSTSAKEQSTVTKSLSNNALTKELAKDKDVLILDELDRRVADERDDKERERLEKVRDELEATDSYAILPISDDKGIKAIIMLSRKLSGEAFSNNDIQLLEVIAPQMASGIQKARLYQEQKEFGVRLQNEVEKATSELKKANVQLKDLDNAKSEFMSIASHQLRTPLAGIMGYLSMLDAGDYGKIKPEQGDIIKDVLDATQRLIRMVNVFLNVTRIEAGRFIMNFTKNSFDTMIEDVYKVLKPTADKKGVKLTFKSSKKLPDVEVDADKIKDVILNFTDNAIKYSPKGEVVVWGEATKNTVVFHCKDTGVGIAKAEVDNLFAKFVRGSGIAQVDPSGSGLGLFIAKKVTEGHGGRVWAESEGEGKGSTFNFEIPIKANPEAKKNAEEFKARAKK